MRGLRSDNTQMSPCGKTSLSRCRMSTANLEECKGCTLVKRNRDKWKMINRKPHKRCNECGEFLPLERYYSRIIKKENGAVYECTAGTCKMRMSEKRRKKMFILNDSK